MNVAYVIKNLKKDIVRKENPNVKEYWHLTGKFRGLAFDKCNLYARRAQISFEPSFFNNLSGSDSHLIFEKLINMPSEICFELREEDNAAKPIEN